MYAWADMLDLSALADCRIALHWQVALQGLRSTAVQRHSRQEARTFWRAVTRTTSCTVRLKSSLKYWMSRSANPSVTIPDTMRHTCKEETSHHANHS